MSHFSNVVNTEVEGECKIRTLASIKMKTSKLIFFTILCILTAGIIALAAKWFVKLQRWLLYIPCDLREATHLFVQNNDDTYSIVILKVHPQDKIYPYYFMNRHLKYLYHQSLSTFQAAEFTFPANISQKDIINKFFNGIDTDEKLSRHRKLYGKCLIEIPLPKLLPFMLEELSNPFFIIQYISCAIWIVEGFIMFAIILVAVSVTLTLMNYVFLYFAKKRLKTLAEQQVSLKVYRSGLQKHNKFQIISSSELVPGDILAIDDQVTVPCDCVLVSGDSLMNESMLTGESIPTPKFPLDEHNDQPFDYNTCKRNILFEGTKVLQIKVSKHEYVLALVLRTGFASIKGQMIRTILFPKPVKFTFNKQGIKYIISLALVCFSLYFVTLAEQIKKDFGAQLIILRFLDVVTWIIPPALPIFMTLAMTVAIIRLRFKGVLGLNPHSVLLAGKVDTCCFDKTGTITDSGIDVHGIYEMDQGVCREASLKAEEEKSTKLVAKLMATCHSAYLINEVLIGDSLDIRMLEYSSWKYRISTNPEIKFQAVLGSKTLEVLKVFEFTSDLQRMSVFIRDVTSNKYYIFTKGAPEKVRNFSLESTIPSDFTDILEGKSIQGFRILGLGYKEVSVEMKEKVLTWSREEIEKNLTFLGFLILENKLKPDSRVCLLRLNEAALRIKLISGDNILTTIQTAKEAGILDGRKEVLITDLHEKTSELCLKILKNGEYQKNIEFEEKSAKMASGAGQLISNTSSFIKNNKVSVEMEPFDSKSPGFSPPKSASRINTLAFSSTNELLAHLESLLMNFTQDYEFAISGPAYNYLDSQSANDRHVSSIFTPLVQKSKVFARMRPEQKTLAVLKLQKLGHMVCMTGDGANDCGALKQADIGVSFSETDASFSAPFTSFDTSIKCVEKVLLEGRATVVNSVEVFRYYISVSFLKFFAVWLLVFSATNLNDFEWTYINYLNSIVSLFLLSFGAPLNKLSREMPPDNLIGLENIFSIYGLMFIGSLGQGMAYIMMRNEDWFDEPLTLIDGNYRMTGPSNTTILFCLNIFYIFAMVTVIISKPFKQRLYRNYVLSIWLCIGFVYNSLLIFYPEIQIPTLYVVNLEEHFKGKLYALLLGFSALMLLYEELFVKKVMRKIERRKQKIL